jgi:hypothetical protein
MDRRGVALDPEIEWFKPKPPGATRSYRLNIARFLGDGFDLDFDTIADTSASIAPSGAGEIQATALTVIGCDLTVELTSGQPTRRYTILFLATTADRDVIPFEVLQDVSPVFPTDFVPPPPSLGFGAAIWGNFMSTLIPFGCQQVTSLAAVAASLCRPARRRCLWWGRDRRSSGVMTGSRPPQQSGCFSRPA